MSPTITFSGANWSHGRDLVRRWLFDGVAVNERSENDAITGEHHIVAVPIRSTKKLLDAILNEEATEHVVSLSGIMSPMPTGSRVTHAHFLFGPWANENLRVIRAEGKAATGCAIANEIFANAEKLGIRTIEMPREDHDKHMAVVQWLAHLVVLALALNEHFDPRFEREVLRPWNRIPASTVTDMIVLNPFVREGVWETFWTETKRTGNISAPFLDFLNRTADRIDAITPNAKRIAGFLEGCEHPELTGLEIIRNAWFEDAKISTLVSRVKDKAHETE